MAGYIGGTFESAQFTYFSVHPVEDAWHMQNICFWRNSCWFFSVPFTGWNGQPIFMLDGSNNARQRDELPFADLVNEIFCSQWLPLPQKKCHSFGPSGIWLSTTTHSKQAQLLNSVYRHSERNAIVHTYGLHKNVWWKLMRLIGQKKHWRLRPTKLRTT